jgi:stage IV sporulation protein FB
MLSFRVGPFPIRVYPWFFLSAVLLGGNFGFGWQMFAWIFVVFLSVLVHELGHALVGRAFGGHPEIHLQAFGGVTFPQFHKPPGPGRQFLLSVAGPVFGLLLGALAWTLVRSFPPAHGSPTDWTMRQFMRVNVLWAVFNLLPILPLDGGQMMLAVVEGIRRKPSLALASWISVALSVAVAGAVTLSWGVDPFLLLFLALFAWQNVLRARAAGAAKPAPAGSLAGDALEQADVARATEETRAAVQGRDYDTALAAAARLENAGGPFRQAAALRLRAGIELFRGDNESAALFAGQSFSLWPSPDAAVVAARANLRSGQQDRARNWLRRAVEAGAPQAAVRNDPELGALA